MMKFSLAKLPGTVNTFRIILICPHCERGFAFFYVCPSRCPHCEEVLPNIAALIKQSDDRLLYHKMGETVSTDRGLKFQ